MIRRFVLITVAAVLVLSGSMAAAVAAGELGLSRDGVTWSSSLPGPLFDPAFRWVPGDSEEETFYVRNQGADDAILNITMLTGPVEALIDTGDLRVAARVGTGAFTAAETAGPHLLVEDVPVDAGAVRKVTVKVDFDPASMNDSQQLQLDLRFNVTLSQNTAVAPPTNPGDGGNGGAGGSGDDLPDTGSVVTPFMFVLAVLLVAAGTGLIGYGRRRTTRLEERPSHVQA